MMRLQRQKGIGLLELMLSISIIGLITVMVIQYFGTSKMNTQTAKGVTEIQAIIGIVSGIPSPLKVQGDNSDLNNAIILSGQLPEQYIVSSNQITAPWPDAVLTASMASSNTLLINLTNIPNWACQSLLDKFRPEISSSKDTNCDKSGDINLNLYFTLNMGENL